MGPTLTWGDIFVRLALTLVAGVLIGLDRNQHAHPAGLRTTVLIALAAAVAMIQANWLTTHTVDLHNQTLRADIMRLPLGSLDGVGFIGAGVILRLWMEASGSQHQCAPISLRGVQRRIELGRTGEGSIRTPVRPRLLRR